MLEDKSRPVRLELSLLDERKRILVVYGHIVCQSLPSHITRYHNCSRSILDYPPFFIWFIVVWRWGDLFKCLDKQQTHMTYAFKLMAILTKWLAWQFTSKSITISGVSSHKPFVILFGSEMIGQRTIRGSSFPPSGHEVIRHIFTIQLDPFHVYVFNYNSSCCSIIMAYFGDVHIIIPRHCVWHNNYGFGAHLFKCTCIQGSV